jgi:hypothetical protein
MKNATFVILIGLMAILSSCGETKHLTAGNYLFKYIDNSQSRINDKSKSDQLLVFKTPGGFESNLEDKTSFQIIKTPLPAGTLPIKTIDLKATYPSKILNGDILYTNETSITELDKSYHRSLTYWDAKFTVAPLTIPLKFRSKIDDGAVYPAQLETGINIGIAPAYKWTFNVFNPTKKILGNSINQYSFNLGPFLNVGGTDLKSVSNAPGLKLDRKAATLSSGGALVFGVNKMSLGYALGTDKVIGEGKSYWVYQKKIWHGILFSVSF